MMPETTLQNKQWHITFEDFTIHIDNLLYMFHLHNALQRMKYEIVNSFHAFSIERKWRFQV
jgi:hypothetical protein